MIQPTLAITLFRRPQYTRVLFEALEKCYGINEIPIVISCDHLESKRYECTQVFRMAEEFAAKHIGTRVFRHNPRLGIDLNKLFVVPKAFESGNFCILLEDDIIPAPDALRYFQAMGERFEFDKTVWSVSGYNRLDEKKWERAKQLPYAVNMSRGYCPWGVAIWKDRWDELFADDSARYKSETGNQANGLHDHWLNEHHRRVVVPVVARTQAIGAENAEHTPSAEWFYANEYNEFGAWLLDLPDAGTTPWLNYADFKYPNGLMNASSGASPDLRDDAGLAPIEDAVIGGGCV